MTDYGFILSLVASIIALWGVYLFNQQRDYTGARNVWQFSNVGFTIYFSLRAIGLIDGGLSDIMMAIYFWAMAWSNWRGMA